MIIGVIGALKQEIEFIKNSLTNVKMEKHSGFSFFVGNINNHKVILTVSGVGKVNMAICATTLINAYNPEMLINTGIAGSINTNIGSVVLPKVTKYYDFIFDEAEDNMGFHGVFKTNKILFDKALSLFKDEVVTGTILTGDRFVTNKNQLNGISLRNVKAIDMESGAFAQTCFRLKKKFLIFRCISDHLDENEFYDNKEFSVTLAASLCLKFIENI